MALTSALRTYGNAQIRRYGDPRGIRRYPPVTDYGGNGGVPAELTRRMNYPPPPSVEFLMNNAADYNSMQPYSAPPQIAPPLQQQMPQVTAPTLQQQQLPQQQLPPQQQLLQDVPLLNTVANQWLAGPPDIAEPQQQPQDEMANIINEARIAKVKERMKAITPSKTADLSDEDFKNWLIFAQPSERDYNMAKIARQLGEIKAKKQYQKELLGLAGEEMPKLSGMVTQIGDIQYHSAGQRERNRAALGRSRDLWNQRFAALRQKYAPPLTQAQALGLTGNPQVDSALVAARGSAGNQYLKGQQDTIKYQNMLNRDKLINQAKRDYEDMRQNHRTYLATFKDEIKSLDPELADVVKSIVQIKTESGSDKAREALYTNWADDPVMSRLILRNAPTLNKILGLDLLGHEASRALIDWVKGGPR